MKKLLLCLILIIGGISGCATPIDIPIGVPPRPTFIPIPITLQDITPPQVLDICAVNLAIAKVHVQKLERRINIHDESL